MPSLRRYVKSPDFPGLVGKAVFFLAPYEALLLWKMF